MLRLANPLLYAFHNLKSSARKKRVGFELTFEEFTEFDRQTGYVEQRGVDASSLTVDRVNPDLPYRVGNIRVMTHSDNSSKQYNYKPDYAPGEHPFE